MKIKGFVKSGLILALLGSVLFSCYFYIRNVQTSMWMQIAEQTLEITSQGGNAFKTYITVAQDQIQSLVNALSEINSSEKNRILNDLSMLGDDTSYFTIVDLDHGYLYSNRLEDRLLLDEGELEYYLTFSGKGLRENYFNIYDGHNTMGVYECFTFSDGTRGLVQKDRRISVLSQLFSLSFFNETGFSYITNQDGDVLIRPTHKNSNRTFTNIFDMLANENDADDIQAFQKSLSEGNSGVIQFSFNGSENVITFSPIGTAEGWYIISIIPRSVIMENAENILQSSRIFMYMVIFIFIIGLLFLLFEQQNRKRIERKEQDVRYREQMFSILSQNIDDVFLMLNGESHAVEYVTPNVDRVLGISRKDVMSDLNTLQEAEYAEGECISHSEFVQMQPGQSVMMESERINRKTAEKHWFYESVYCVGDNQSEKFIIVLSDRTKEKQNKLMLETALNAANAANKAKSDFFNNVSHDIRTPMNAIMGFATLLKQEGGNPQRVKEYTSKIMASSQYLLSLVNDVLDMSKIESGKTALNLAEFNLADLIDELMTLIRPLARAKRQEFKLSLIDVTEEHLIGDGLRINQVLLNILSNAVKYTPTGGRIRMTITQLPQKIKNFVSLRFDIQDNGIGMSEEFLKVIFEPFARESNDCVNQMQGTGLGMPIVKNLVELMGGMIDVKSKQGEGSLFTVELELRIQDKDKDKEFWQSRRIARMLVVDNEESTFKNVANAMKNTGVSIQYASDVDSALRQLEQAHQEGILFDVVLLDWEMPGMDGIRTAGKIRAMLPEHVPIILHTACERVEIKDEELAAGISGFLSKPFFVSSFKQALVMVQTEKENNPVTETSDSRLAGLNILAAEDNELNAEILTELLHLNNAACDIVGNGRELVEAFEKSEPGQYDLILTDIQMPVMNGYDAARAIRAGSHPCGKIIPIVAMTANAFAEDVREAMNAGMNAHVPKPIDMKKLENVISELIREKK